MNVQNNSQGKIETSAFWLSSFLKVFSMIAKTDARTDSQQKYAKYCIYSQIEFMIFPPFV